MRFLVLPLVAVTSLAAAQVEQYLNTTRFAWGVGSGLPAPYTLGDMNVTFEVKVFGAWIPYTSTLGISEAVIAKNAGTPNFSVPINSVTTLFSSSQPIVWSGSVSGQQVTWTTNQTFSQPGGYTFSGTFDNNGSPLVVNLTINDVATTGTLRSVFGSISPLAIPTIGRVANVRGTHSGGDSFNQIDMDAGSASGTVQGVPVTDFRAHFRNIQHIAHPPMPLRVNGVLNLGDVESGDSVFAIVELLPMTGDIPEWVRATMLPQGSFSLPVFGDGPIDLAQPTTRRMRITTHSFLTRIVPVTISENPGPVAFNMVNGDVDRSNEVDLTDIDQAIAHYGTAGTGLEGLWPDVNLSGEVDLTDIDIIIFHYGEGGD